ncbi:protein UL21A [Human betaherpesvirus 5]|nr:protein UL21A [Human betaherpesvirus 5]
MGGSPVPQLTTVTQGLMPSVRMDFRARRPLRRLAFYAPRARRRLFQNHIHPEQRRVLVGEGDEQMLPDLPMEIDIVIDRPPQQPLPNPLVLLLDDVPPHVPGFAPYRVPRPHPMIPEEHWDQF